MVANKLYLLGVELDEFQTILRSAVASVLQEQKDIFSQSIKKSDDEYLSRADAAKFLKVSKTTLWHLDKTQVLPARRLNGKVLYLKSDLLNFSSSSEGNKFGSR